MTLLALMVMGLMGIVSTVNAADEVTNRLPRMHMMLEQPGDSIRKHVTPEELTARMTSSLGLTEDQAKKVLELNTKYKDIIGRPMGMRGPGRRPRGGRGMQPGAPGMQRDSLMERPQLTEEQKAAMKEKMEERRTQIKAYQEGLKSILTEEQLQKMEQAQKEAREMRRNTKPMD